MAERVTWLKPDDPIIQAFLRKTLIPLYCLSGSISSLANLLNQGPRQQGDCPVSQFFLTRLFGWGLRKNQEPTGTTTQIFGVVQRAAEAALQDDETLRRASEAFSNMSATVLNIGFRDPMMISSHFLLPPAVASALLEGAESRTCAGQGEELRGDPLTSFLADCHNAQELLELASRAEKDSIIVKIPIPLDQNEAVLLDDTIGQILVTEIKILRRLLAAVPAGSRTSALTNLMIERGDGVPASIWRRIEHLIDPGTGDVRIFRLDGESC
jgi:hypothetical protein